jgi:hypothetical protein
MQKKKKKTNRMTCGSFMSMIGAAAKAGVA